MNSYSSAFKKRPVRQTSQPRSLTMCSEYLKCVCVGGESCSTASGVCGARRPCPTNWRQHEANRHKHAYTHIARSGQDLLLCLIEAAEVNLLVDCRVRSYCGATFRPARDVRVRMRSAVACLCVYGPDRIPPVRVRKAARHIRDNFVLTMST